MSDSCCRATSHRARQIRGSPLPVANPDDFDLIAAFPELGDLGIVLIDDFHRLPEEVKHKLADFIKLLADIESTKSKIIIVGINKAGHSLLSYAADLTGRLDTITFRPLNADRVFYAIWPVEAAHG